MNVTSRALHPPLGATDRRRPRSPRATVHRDGAVMAGPKGASDSDSEDYAWLDDGAPSPAEASRSRHRPPPTARPEVAREPSSLASSAVDRAAWFVAPLQLRSARAMPVAVAHGAAMAHGEWVLWGRHRRAGVVLQRFWRGESGGPRRETRAERAVEQRSGRFPEPGTIATASLERNPAQRCDRSGPPLCGRGALARPSAGFAREPVASHASSGWSGAPPGGVTCGES